VLNHLPGVRDSAVVGAPVGDDPSERVHAVLVLDPGVSPDTIARDANAQLADPQRIRRALVWPDTELPRTEGTRKLKRAAIREWIKGGQHPSSPHAGGDKLLDLIAARAGRHDLPANASLEELGLSSLERVELMVALEDTFHTRIDEAAFAEARDLSTLRALVEQGAAAGSHAAEPVDFPTWNRSTVAHAIRSVSLATWILPLAWPFIRLRIEGLEHVQQLNRPVMFAANHQSHMDVPVVMLALPRRWRYHLAPAMMKEFFKAHFFPEQFGRRAWFTNSLNYYLAAMFFNAFPLPQREAGARQTLRYIGEVLESGYSVLIFPEGRRDPAGSIGSFRPGIGMIASRLDVPVVPVRIDGLEKVLPPSARWPTRGDVRVAFGPPIHLQGADYEALARQVEDAVRNLSTFRTSRTLAP
jgi:long-chain acyl-CoA synthetase